MGNFAINCEETPLASGSWKHPTLGMPRYLVANGRRTGFTLVEILVCLTLVAILGTVAGTTMSRALANIRMFSASRQLTSQLYAARQAALMSGQSAAVCAASYTSAWKCLPGSRTWITFQSAAGGSPTQVGRRDRILAIWDLPNRVHIRSTRTLAAYLPQTSAATTVSFALCYEGEPDLARTIIVSQTGRPREVSGPAATLAPDVRCSG
jgi:prepilin-type N-terminal cleavage/methylation domain-containing protein